MAASLDKAVLAISYKDGAKSSTTLLAVFNTAKDMGAFVITLNAAIAAGNKDAVVKACPNYPVTAEGELVKGGKLRAVVLPYAPTIVLGDGESALVSFDL